MQLELVVADSELLARCRDLFELDRYEEAIFVVYKMVEEEVRNKAGLNPTDIGESLMTKALHPDSGSLTIPSCKVRNEQGGVYNLFKGGYCIFQKP